MIIFFLKRVIGIVFLLYTVMIIVRLVASWFPQFMGYPIMHFLAVCTDPYLNVFRSFIPLVGAIDLSPLVALLALQATKWILLAIL